MCAKSDENSLNASLIDGWFNDKYNAFQKEYSENLKKMATSIADQQRSEEVAYQQQLDSGLQSPIVAEEDESHKFKQMEEERIAKFDQDEREKVEDLRKSAKKDWALLEEEQQKRISAIQSQQEEQLAVEQEWLRAALAAGAGFDPNLFEKLVDKCGKGRNSAYAQTKMSRFWQAFDEGNNKTMPLSSSTAQHDELINVLKGL